MNQTKAGPHIKVFNRSFPLPRSYFARLVVGYSLVFGGILGFLPILGYWMIPFGVTVLSHDSPRLRRLRRRSEVAIVRRWRVSPYRQQFRRMKKRFPLRFFYARTRTAELIEAARKRRRNRAKNISGIKA